MTKTVDVRTVGWGTDCEYQVTVDEVYHDDSGTEHTETVSENRLRCSMQTVNAKTDYCTTCGKTLIYP